MFDLVMMQRFYVALFFHVQSSCLYPFILPPTLTEAEDEEVELEQVDGDGYTMVLPSGATVGHRSLLRYYKQSLNPRYVGIVENDGRLSGKTEKPNSKISLSEFPNLS